MFTGETKKGWEGKWVHWVRPARVSIFAPLTSTGKLNNITRVSRLDGTGNRFTLISLLSFAILLLPQLLLLLLFPCPGNCNFFCVYVYKRRGGNKCHGKWATGEKHQKTREKEVEVEKVAGDEGKGAHQLSSHYYLDILSINRLI